MSDIHKFIFEGLPVRGAIVRLTDAWLEILTRRAANTSTGAYPLPVQALLGEMAAAGVLMQSGIKFDGALILQVQGDGPVKLLVAEVQGDLSLRATATVQGEVALDATLSEMVNANNQGRCAITLDPKARAPGQQTYQGVVPLFGDRHEKLEKLSDVLAHYMLQSEQLDTTLVLAANAHVAAGLLIQRLPKINWGQIPIDSPERTRIKELESDPNYSEGQIGKNEDYQRIALLANTLKPDELLTLDADTILHRLFWEENLLRFAPAASDTAPRFACTCSRERVGSMIRGLGAQETESILQERGDIEVACEFCGLQYRFDPIDAAQVFANPAAMPSAPRDLQ